MKLVDYTVSPWFRLAVVLFTLAVVWWIVPRDGTLARDIYHRAVGAREWQLSDGEKIVATYEGTTPRRQVVLQIPRGCTLRVNEASLSGPDRLWLHTREKPCAAHLR
jgi:hypothetical protein